MKEYSLIDEIKDDEQYIFKIMYIINSIKIPKKIKTEFLDSLNDSNFLEFEYSYSLVKKVVSDKYYEMIKRNLKTKIVPFFKDNNINESEILNYLKESINVMSDCKEISASYITYLDFNYPFKLRKIYNPPYILYTIGNIELLNKKIVAVIGSREPTNYSSSITKKIVNKLLKKGYVVVSGLAVGIDSVSHVECTKKGMENTIGVLGTGLHKEVFYPRLNYYLYTDMLEKNNLVISELSPKMKGNRYTFPLRNRIIAGLSESIIAIQAKLNSGSIITCNEALNQGKDVYIPLGPIDEPMHKGTNLLIKDGAIPITDLGDIDDYF